MVTAAKEETTKKNGAGVEMPPGFRPVEVNRRVYKADTCRSTPLHGELLGWDRITVKRDENPEWVFGVVRLMSPCKSVNRDGEIGTSKIGEEVMFTISAKLLQQLATPIRNRDYIYPVWIKPCNEKQKLGGGKTMWLYDVGIDEEHRTKRIGGMPVFTATSVAGLLGPANEAANFANDGDSADPESDIPFG